MTVTTDPADATDASAVISAVTAVSDNAAVATVAPHDGGGFDVTLVAPAVDGDGKANVTFTSGSLTAVLAVTVTAATAG